MSNNISRENTRTSLAKNDTSFFLPAQRVLALAVTVAGLEILWNLVYSRLPIYLSSPLSPLPAAPLNALVHIGVTAAIFLVLGSVFRVLPFLYCRRAVATLVAAAYAAYAASTVVSRYLFLNEAISPTGYKTIVSVTILAVAGATVATSRWLARRRTGASGVFFWTELLLLSAFIALCGLALKYSLQPVRFFVVFIPILLCGHLAVWLFVRKSKPVSCRFFVKFVILVILVTFGRGLWSISRKRTSLPHLVFIVLDAARADRMSLYGYPARTTPFIDSLAEAGSLVFDQAYSTANYTYPSHVSLFTALYCRSHDLWHGTDLELDRYRGFDNLAGSLRERGYRTFLLTENPWITGLNRGFDYCHYLDLAGVGVSGWQGTKETLSATPSTFPSFLGNTPSPFVGRQLLDHLLFIFQGYFKPVVEDYELRLLREQLLLRRRDQPLFCFLNMMTVHTRYYPAPSREVGKTIFPYDWSRDYDQAMIHLDRRLREMWDLFRDAGELDRTVFLISSDHGELLGEYGIFGHTRSFFQGVIRVPLLFISSLWNGKETVTFPVSLVSVKPALELLADRFTPEFSRRELTAVFDNKPVVAEHRSIQALPGGDHYRGWMFVSPDREKLVFDQEAPTFKSSWGQSEDFLFDLVRDPEETGNLYSAEPGLVEKLERLREEWKEETPEAGPVDSGRIAPGLDRRLRALGYFN